MIINSFINDEIGIKHQRPLVYFATSYLTLELPETDHKYTVFYSWQKKWIAIFFEQNTEWKQWCYQMMLALKLAMADSVHIEIFLFWLQIIQENQEISVHVL